MLIGCLLLAACSSWSVSHPALRDELMQMMERDQSARKQLTDKGYEHVDSLDVARVAAIDSVNIQRLQQIIEENGWPRKAQVGAKGVKSAFLIVQHADYAFQKEMLPIVRQAYEQQELSGQDLALLTDRVLVGEDKPQRYGTQAYIADGILRFSPIEDEATVDERRAAIGLMPLAEYRKRLLKMYGLKDNAD